MSDTQTRRAQKTRRLIFSGVFLSITIGLLLPFQPEVTPSVGTKSMFSFIENIKPGSTILISFDHESASFPEMKPLATAVVSHLLKRDVKIIAISLFPEGAGLGASLLRRLGEENKKTYGTDFVFLGFKPEPRATILGMGKSFSFVFPFDFYGTKTSDLPIMSADRYSDVVGVITIADGSYPSHWIEYGAAKYELIVLSALAASMVTSYDPYVTSGQLHSILGGLRGAAEYESLLNVDGGGSRAMLAQTAAHIFIVLILIVGNISYLRSRKKKV